MSHNNCLREMGVGGEEGLCVYFLIFQTMPVSFVSYLGYSINHANILQPGFTL